MAVSIQTISGDTAPILNFTLSRNGVPVDLTDCTVVFEIQDPVTKQHTNDSSNHCVIVNPPQGQCQYSWTLGGSDTPDVGTYSADIVITYPSTRIETAPVTISAKAHV